MVASRLFDLLLAIGIVLARVLTLVAVLALLLYLLLRPFGTAPPAGASAPSIWAEVSAWPTLLANTLVVVGTASAVNLAIGWPLGFLLFRTDLPGRQIIAALILLSVCVPVYVSASAILSVVGVRPWDGNAWMVGAIHGWIGVPWAALLLGLGYQELDGTLEEAACLDAPRARVFFVFDARLILWSFIGVILLQTWLAGMDVTVSDLLSVRTFAEEIYMTFQLTQSTRVQLFVALPYAAMFLLLVLGLARAARSADAAVLRFDERAPATVRLGRWRWVLMCGVIGVLAALGGLPIWRLAGEVGTLGDFVQGARGMRSEWVQTATLALAGSGTLLVVVMAVGDWLSTGGRTAALLRLGLLLLLAVPTPLLAIALKELAHRPEVPGFVHDTPALLIVGQALRWLPLVVLAAFPGWVQVTQELRDAARIDGCDLARMHRNVYWPVAMRFLAISAFAALVLIFGELTASVLLAPAEFLPLAVRFFTLAHYGISGKAAAVCLLALLVMVIPWGVLAQLLHRPR